MLNFGINIGVMVFSIYIFYLYACHGFVTIFYLFMKRVIWSRTGNTIKSGLFVSFWSVKIIFQI